MNYADLLKKLKAPEGYTDSPVTDEVREFLRTAPMRVEHVPAGWYGSGYTRPLIEHDGVWKSLCRTDLCDNVATGSCMDRTVEEWRQHYLSKLDDAIGVRVGAKMFAVIDAVSDG